MKALVVYFSRTGENIVRDEREIIEKGFTEIVAEKICGFVNGTLLKLEPVEAYPENYDECNARARYEDSENIFPEIKNLPESIAEYDTIYLGFPLWYRSYPRIIATFISEYQFVGKIIKPFCTNEEGNLGMSELELKSAIKGAIIRQGLAIRGHDANTSDEVIKAWV